MKLNDLQIDEVFVFYDQPLLFSTKDKTSEDWYLALLIDSIDQEDHWLYAPISLERLEKVKNGQLDIRTVFSNSEPGFVYKVKTKTSEWKLVEQIQCSELGDESLPMPDQFLTSSEWGEEAIAHNTQN
jgi:hypothetical protein